VGQLAYVEAATVDGVLEATRIVLATDRAGQIEVIEPGKDTLIVSGERIHLAPGVAKADNLAGHTLRAGDWIFYQAEPGQDGTLTATQLSAGRPGLVERRDASFEERVATWFRDAKTRRVAYLSVEGFVRGTPDQPSIMGLRLDRSAQGNNIVGRARRSGARVRIGGVPDAAGQLKIEGPPRWLAPPLAQPAPNSSPTPTTPNTPTTTATPPTPAEPPTAKTPKPPIRPVDTPVRPHIVKPDMQPVRPVVRPVRPVVRPVRPVVQPVRPVVRPDVRPVVRPDVRPKVVTPDRIRR
jgi:hypothetical protein